MAMQPMALFGLEVPADGVPISARPDIPAAFRITMAAIDPTAEVEGDSGGALPRATLKIIRQIDDEDSDDDEMELGLAEYDDSDEDEDDEDEEDDETNGGPSDPQKSNKAKREAAQKEIKKLLEEDGMDVDDKTKTNGVNGIAKSVKAKGKMPAGEDDEEDEDEDDLDDDEDLEGGGEIEEFVVCTLDPNKNYQQTLDITIGEDERVGFMVSGTHSIFLTGNYVEPAENRSTTFQPDSDEEDEYDSDEDELDDLEDPRITEIDEVDDEEGEEVPTLVKVKAEKLDKRANKNKRPAPESADEDEPETLDDMITKSAKTEAVVNGEQKLSKKQLKKLKKNDGAAAAAPVVQKAEEKVVDAPSSTKSDKKVSFAKELEQGPTPTKDKATTDKSNAENEKAKPKATLGVKVAQGVTIDDKKLGSGAAAKNGDRVGMRYIGKLQKDGKIFDSNKKGKPFSFKLGAGEVIKGWEIGVQGMQAGAERRITIPPHLAYGSKKNGEIPAGSTLLFDIKMLEINRSK